MSTKHMKLHAKVLDARIQLANKKDQRQWKIEETENGWFVVTRKQEAK
jgi:hypothetical protein